MDEIERQVRDLENSAAVSPTTTVMMLDVKDILPCGHSRMCLQDPESPMHESECGWCMMIEDRDYQLREVEKLVACLNKMAVTIHGGTVEFPGDLGFVNLYGGTLVQRTTELESP